MPRYVCEDLIGTIPTTSLIHAAGRQLTDLVSDSDRVCSAQGCSNCSVSQICFTCSSNLKLQPDGSCACDPVELLEDGICKPCSKKHPGCAVCSQDKCLECFHSFLLSSQGECLKDLPDHPEDPNCAQTKAGKCVQCKKNRFCSLECSIYSYDGCVDSCNAPNQVLIENALGQPFCKQCGEGCQKCEDGRHGLRCVQCEKGLETRGSKCE